MGEVSARGIDQIRGDYPQVYEAMLSMIKAVNQIGSVTGAAATGTAQTPGNQCQLFVVAADGIFDVAILDPQPARGVAYFLEYDTDSSFGNAKTIFLGPGRAWRGELGSGTFYFRCYLQLQGSNVSNIVYLGNPATGVTGGGALAGPVPQDSTGSGSSLAPGNGYGQIGPIQPQAVNL